MWPREVTGQFSKSSSIKSGPGIAKHFAIPYNRKLWAVPLTEHVLTLRTEPKSLTNT